MLRLTEIYTSEVLNQTAHRLIRWGMSEREASSLARLITLESDSRDAVVEQAVIEALVSAKQAIDGITEIEYLGGQRRDTLRLESR